MRLAAPALALALAATGCRRSRSSASPPADAYVVLDAPERPGAGPGGGLLGDLRFAVVGDSRPANIDDTAHYPSGIVRQVFAAVEAEQPYPAFVVTTGDYMFASAGGGQVDPQLDLYLAARAAYAGIVYPTMGNHECTAATSSNCGPGLADGTPANYTGFVDRLLGPIGEPRPYYAERFAALDGSWTAKLVFVAGNSWSDAQARWLELVLAEPSTYTFVIRHEPHVSVAAPGVTPSQEIMARHPLTMLLVGHTHTYEHVPAYRELIVGNGGAPLTAGVDYGYVVIARRPDATLQVTSYDYASHAIVEQFAVTADGVVTP